MFSSLTREQKQRRDALLEAKQLLACNNINKATPEQILQTAMFILNDEVPAKRYEKGGMP